MTVPTDTGPGVLADFATVMAGTSLVLVKVQAMFEPAAVAAALRAKAPVARVGVAVPPVPIPEQVADVNT